MKKERQKSDLVVESNTGSQPYKYKTHITYCFHFAATFFGSNANRARSLYISPLLFQFCFPFFGLLEKVKYKHHTLFFFSSA